MIVIKRVAIGDENEAYIENNLNSSLNIIYSNDNNKGKTIVAQAFYYTIGNEPIFPSEFNYKNYYFVLDLNVNDKEISICRKNTTFVVYYDNIFKIFNGTSEFKRFFTKEIYKLPIILKKEREKLVDLELFFQLFFVGQDGRDTSKIFNSGYNNKEDFINMIYSMTNCIKIESDIDKNEIKKQISELNEERILLKKQNEILNQNVSAVNLISYTRNKENIKKKIKETEKIKEELIELKNDRNKINNKKIKNEILLKELNSLNRTLSEGQLTCLDCNSKRIGFENKDEKLNFNVSDLEIRKNIIEVITERIEIYEEEISKLDLSIKNKQDELNKFLHDDDVSLENVLLYKAELQNAHDADKRIIAIDEYVEQLNDLLKKVQVSENKTEKSKKTIEANLLEQMMFIYKKIDPEGNLNFSALFTAKNQNYSGSEGSEYYISKIYSFAKILQHPFPIVIDSFREGELSTSKEKIIIDYFRQLPNQVIFTATLKEEEYNKYESKEFSHINKIDYSEIKTCHLLNKSFVYDLKKLLKNFSINI